MDRELLKILKVKESAIEGQRIELSPILLNWIRDQLEIVEAEATDYPPPKNDMSLDPLNELLREYTSFDDWE